MPVDMAQAHRALLDAAVALAARRDIRRLLVVCDRPLPDGVVRPRSPARSKVLYAMTSRARLDEVTADGFAAIRIPRYKLTRFERLKLALIAAVGEGYLRTGDLVLALVSLRPLGRPDSLNLGRAGVVGEEIAIGQSLTPDGGSPEVLEAAIELAVAIGADGWEGHPVGALIVVGDEEGVLARSRPLLLNPFAGHPEAQRNLLDPEVREAIRPFAILDGAFLVRGDGIVTAAGRYLAPRARGDVPLGLGARHMAAASITAETRATAIAVSQTSGAVRVFRQGRQVLELRSARRF